MTFFPVDRTARPVEAYILAVLSTLALVLAFLPVQLLIHASTAGWSEGVTGALLSRTEWLGFAVSIPIIGWHHFDEASRGDDLKTPRDVVRSFLEASRITLLCYVLFGAVYYVAYYLSEDAETAFGAVVAAFFVAMIVNAQIERFQIFPFARTVRGRPLLSLEEACESAQAATRPNETRHFWGGLDVPKRLLDPCYVITGTASAGKTLVVRMLMRTALFEPDGRPRYRAVVYDQKRTMYPILRGMGVPDRDIYVFQPFDTRSVAWDLAADVTAPATARQIADILIPPEAGETQRYFIDAARELLTGVMNVFCEVSPGNWSLNDLLEACANPQSLGRVLSKTRAGQDTAATYLKLGDNTLLSVVSTLRNKIAPYREIGPLWERAARRLSLVEWVKDKRPTYIVLGTDESASSAVDPINRAIFKRLTELVLSRTDEDPVDETWFFLDEVRFAGRLDGLNKLMVAGRSKGARVVLGFQDIIGLREIYGKAADEIVGLCGNVTVLRLNNPDTREWAAKLFGQYEHWKSTHGTTVSSQGETHSTSFQIAERWAMLPQEFGTFPPTTEEHGLSGAWGAPGLACWRGTVPPEVIAQHLAPIPEGASGFVERPPEDQRRIPWAPDDLRRLGLPVSDGRPREMTQEEASSR